MISMYLVFKVILTGLLVAAISVAAKKSSTFGALIASLPLTSILAMVWMYHEDKNIQAIGELSLDIFWLVIPSLIFFIMMPFLLKKSLGFYPSLLVSCFTTTVTYFLFFRIKNLILS